MKPVSGFKCDFCNRMFLRPVNASQHETACKYNPKRRMCATCKNLQMISTDGMVGWLHGIMTRGCIVHNAPINDRPWEIECDTNDHGYRSGKPEPIPGTCGYYETRRADDGTD